MKALVNIIIVIVMGAISTAALANNLNLSDGEIVSVQSADGTAVIQLNVSWDNAWRDLTNYDAVWVFGKFSTDGGSTWEHLTLSGSGTNPYGFSAGTGSDLEIVVPNDRKGCFIQLYANGTGTVDAGGLQIVWDFDADGVSEEEIDDIGLKIFGIETVYIPEGAFYAGDSAFSTASLLQGSGDTDPWYVDSAGGISVENTTSNGYYYVSSGNAGEDLSGAEFIIPASFPKGVSGLYVMKYEITEGQWVDFFNTLTDIQKAGRDITGVSGKNSDSAVNRNTISWSEGDATTARPNRVSGYLSWMDICAYADWAGLRPMTELEFEKISRGEDTAIVAGELSWGNTTIDSASNITAAEDGTETLSNVSSNCCYNNVTFTGGDGGSGPLRAGIFATSTSSRSESGSAFYGVMEMSGNVWEHCVTIGNSSGRAFKGTHGDGSLSSSGHANNEDWPGYQAGQGVAAASGSGFKGGSWLVTTTNLLAVSNRSKAAFADTSRSSDYGGRLARTAP